MTTPETQAQLKGPEDQVADGGKALSSLHSWLQKMTCVHSVRPNRSEKWFRSRAAFTQTFNILMGQPLSAFSILICREINSKHLAMELFVC